MSGSFLATGVMPVTLSAFNISTQSNNLFYHGPLKREINADYFSIRKSINGTDFKEIGKVSATGNSVTKKNYSFSDETIAPGINYVYYALGNRR